MAEGRVVGHGRARRAGGFTGLRHLGDDALRFTKWYVKGKYALMEGFLGELDEAPEARDAAALRSRYHRAILHGRRVSGARTFVTVLLALGAATSVLATLAFAAYVPGPLRGDVALAGDALRQVAAWAATSALVLVVLRVALDRYLEMVETSALFLAMQLATCERAPEAA